MKKLITSLACGTVLSISLLGAGNAANAAGTAGMGSAVPDTGMNGLKTENRTENRTGNTMGNMGTRTGAPMLNQEDNTLMNRTTGTTHRNDSIMNDRIRTGTNDTLTQYPDTSRGTKYRATSTTTAATTNGRGSNWGWLGLLGLLGLAGMRSRSGERDRQ
ncbi:WGxxGxxG family protein [Paenibacillus sp. FSL H7-0357]|uniref:WGxxGxxG family protein n=1 Tax=Paenibacillus sp. FSL H7-0357 TaxID=1536774 RepID=UPI0006917F46|nr:WGxxGxxG family protein [Paenibacillus sp. FSL H7-0357]